MILVRHTAIGINKIHYIIHFNYINPNFLTVCSGKYLCGLGPPCIENTLHSLLVI